MKHFKLALISAFFHTAGINKAQCEIYSYSNFSASYTIREFPLKEFEEKLFSDEGRERIRQFLSLEETPIMNFLSPPKLTEFDDQKILKLYFSLEIEGTEASGQVFRMVEKAISDIAAGNTVGSAMHLLFNPFPLISRNPSLITWTAPATHVIEKYPFTNPGKLEFVSTDGTLVKFLAIIGDSREIIFVYPNESGGFVSHLRSHTFHKRDENE